MLSLLESRKEIAAAQRALKATMRREFPKTETRNITFRGGLFRDAKVFTNGSCWYHAGDHAGKDGKNPRFLNEFGSLGLGSLQITVEINVLHEGRSGRVAGFFARETATGAICLMHSGRVGGGYPGVGGETFRAWLEKRPCEVFDASGEVHFGFIVMSIDGLGATISLVRYVNDIARFKRAVRDGEIDPEDPSFQQKVQGLNDFYSEPRGRRTGRRSGRFDFVSRHGDVVDALKSWRMHQRMRAGHRIAKNLFIDMGVANVNEELVEIYEVKTSASRSDVYSAIGQLMVHGPQSCRMVIVLPHDERLVDDLRDALQRHRIRLLRFKLDRKGAVITAGV